jgi:hypothetical protein
VRVVTDGSGREGHYFYETTALSPGDEASNSTMRYFMIKKGLPSREAWQKYVKYWDEIDREIIIAFAMALASASPAGARDPEELLEFKATNKLAGRSAEEPGAVPGEAATGDEAEMGLADTQPAPGEPAGAARQGAPDTGHADTQPAPPRRPDNAHPLDSTAEAKSKGGETLDTESPKPGSQAKEDKPAGVPRSKVEPVERIPADKEIVVKTPAGNQKMTVGEYRARVAEASKWLSNETWKLDLPKGAGPTDELIKEAQQKFGLDDYWYSIANPYTYGKL